MAKTDRDILHSDESTINPFRDKLVILYWMDLNQHE